MPESTPDLEGRLARATAPGVQDRLLDKGLARGLIWRDGTLPPGSPGFSPALTTDLLDYAHTVMAMALRLRASGGDAAILERAFLVAGEAIEAAIHHGAAGPDRGFHRVTAAVAFHLAGYAARAYSLLPGNGAGDNLAPTEAALVYLLRRALDEMEGALSSWLLDPEHADSRIAARLRAEADFDEEDAAHAVITASFMRGLALFDHAIRTGDPQSAASARLQLAATAGAASDVHAVSHWWTATLASHLIAELWRLSLHQRIPVLGPHDDDSGRWATLRSDYIQRLRADKRSAIELWPSQVEAAARALDPSDDLVVALPTSAGKTRVAELCILRALAARDRVVYVTPLRALSAQVERDLSGTFRPLGFSVSSLYGSAGVEGGDAETLRRGTIVVSTPEKLDFALRNDNSIIDDVGLVVLDEGHMLGPNEREVRYEALVQRLLRRDDARQRRIVCLSALFPAPAEMDDLVGWIRQDAPGGPVHSTWRPTRQRFGVLVWTSGAARLSVKVEEESPFVPRFIESRKPPKGSRRRKPFPADKNELTLGAAWRFVEQGKRVLVYCALRKSVETLGSLVLECVRHAVLAPLGAVSQRVEDAVATGSEWLGADHPAVRCLKYGVALHHGGLPRPFLAEVEQLLRSSDWPVVIASPTLAQGLNLSASVLLVPSIWRNQEVIPAAEFANVAGRAGRAFVDVEGLVLHVVWGSTTRDTERALRNWAKLLAAARAPRVASGLLHLSAAIFRRIATVAGVPPAEVLEYVTGHTRAWDFDASAGSIGVSEAEWERDLASIDAAVLALLDAETAERDIASGLEDVLQGSLFSRQLAAEEEETRDLLRDFVIARARQIWSQTQDAQRKGYHAAGIGLRAGQFLDRHLDSLLSLLQRAELAVLERDGAAAAEAIVKFAQLAFQTAPFRAPGDLPTAWRDALRAWIGGQRGADVVRMCGDEGVDLLQEALTYRLPWALEAVRVHAVAVGKIGSDEFGGLAALAVEAGSVDLGVVRLLRSGLRSREAAIAAVASTGAFFDDHAGMLAWVRSDEVRLKSADPAWPTAESRHAWLEFYEEERMERTRRWRRETQPVRVRWSGNAPARGVHVVVQPSVSGEEDLVLAPDFSPLGVARSPLRRPHADVVDAWVSDEPETISVEYFGPPSPHPEQ